jgi:filamentous hemagglutinin family protein
MMNNPSAKSASLWCKLFRGFSIAHTNKTLSKARLLIREFLVVVLLLHLSVSQALSVSAITSDGTLGTTVNQGGTTYNITGGTRNGANLFHSLGLFSVGTGDTANFLNNTGLATTNILGRITGGQVSNILGTIKTTNFGAANLFLINPAGWVFGPTASLNVGGSFHVSTADYLKFADGAKFHADLSKQSVLTSAPVSAFGFLSQNPAEITIQESVLEVPNAKTLSMIGGNISISGGPLGFLGALAGTINLASVGSPGEVPVNVQDINLTDFTRLGQINLFNSALLDASGNGGGTVVIRAGKFVVDSSLLFADNLGTINANGLGMDIHIAGDAIIRNDSFITTDGLGSGRARDLQITAGTLQVDQSLIGSRPFGSGNGGNITLSASENISLTGESRVQSATSTLGNAGNINLTAGQDINANRANIESFAAENSFGRAGDVIMVAGRDLQLNRTTIDSSSSGFGAAGSVWAEAQRDAVFLRTNINSSSAGFGAAGAVRVDAQRDAAFSLTNIDSSSIDSIFNNGFAGAGGDVALTAGRNLSFIGGIFTSTDSIFGNRAGDVTITAQDQAVIEVSDISTGAFSTSSRGGDVNITADRLTLDLSAINTSSFGSRAGHVRIDVGELEMKNSSFIRTRMLLDGTAGDIVINADRAVTISGGATRPSILDASVSQVTGFPTPNGDAGSIAITAPALTLDNATVSSVTPGKGRGGSIELKGRDIAAVNETLLSGGALGDGPGGSISIAASRSITFEGKSGIVNGTDGAGDAGPVNLSAPVVTLSGENLIGTNAFGSGNGGPITIEAAQVILRDSFGLTSISLGTGTGGKGGDITIKASDSVLLTTGPMSNRPTGIFTSTGGDGDAGNIYIRSPQLTIVNSNLAAFSTDGFNLNNRGNAGNITLDVGQLTLQDNARISAGTNGASALGAGGNVTITATNSVLVDGSSAILNGVEGSGHAGDVKIKTPTLTLSAPGGLIESSTLGTGAGGLVEIDVKTLSINGGSAIATGSDGPGPGGTLKVLAENLNINGRGGLFTDSSAEGPAGNIEIVANRITLGNGGQISAESQGTGNTGNIRIVANNSLRSSGGSITAKSESSDGGNIHLKVGELVDLFSSQITTSVGTGNGSGGNITIDPTFVILNHSHITANAFGGPGGNIKIVADVFLASSDSSVTASSALSTPGTVNIQAAITNVSGLLQPLPENIFQATSLLQQSCAARFSGGKLSSLVVGSLVGLPWEPGSFMPSPLYRLAEKSNPSITQAGPGAESFQLTLASAKPKFSLNWPCVK